MTSTLKSSGSERQSKIVANTGTPYQKNHRNRLIHVVRYRECEAKPRSNRSRRCPITVATKLYRTPQSSFLGLLQGTRLIDLGLRMSIARGSIMILASKVSLAILLLCSGKDIHR